MVIMYISHIVSGLGGSRYCMRGNGQGIVYCIVYSGMNVFQYIGVHPDLPQGCVVQPEYFKTKPQDALEL